MPKKKSPGFWFFTGDWLKDTELRFCSLFARGLLVDLLCIMFESQERGYMSKPNGAPRSNEEIVDAISGGDRQEKLDALQELEDSGVLSRDDRGVLYSRRLARLAETSEKRKENGSKRGSKTEAKGEQKGQQNGSKRAGVSDTVSDSDSFSPPRSPPKSEELNRQAHAIYQEYPLKEGKQAAIKKIKTALSLIDYQPLMDAVREYAACVATWPKDKRKYIPQPATWFGQGRWEDERSAWLKYRAGPNSLEAKQEQFDQESREAQRRIYERHCKPEQETDQNKLPYVGSGVQKSE